MGSYNKRISDQSKIKFDPINRELIDSENSELDSRVDVLETTVGDATSGLVKDVNDLESGYTIINGNLSAIYKSGAKNLLPITISRIKQLNTSGTWDDNEYTRNGITYTINTDDEGNITKINAKGTTTNGSGFQLSYGSYASGNYILNGCPPDGSYSTYYIKSGGTVDDKDYGEGTTTTSYNNVYIFIESDVTIDKDFYPMVRLSSVSDPTFQPYAMTNLELTNKLKGLIKSTTFTGTTSSNGNMSILPIPSDKKYIALYIETDSTEYLYNFYTSSARDAICANFRGISSPYAPVTSETVSGTVYYIEL